MNPMIASPSGRQPQVYQIISHTEQPDTLPRLARQHESLHEIMLISSGKAFCTIDHQHFHVAAGDILVCRAGTRHALLPSHGLCYYSIFFNGGPEHFGTETLLPDAVYHCEDAMPHLLSLTELLCTHTDQQLPAAQGHLLSAMLLQIGASGARALPAQTLDQTTPAYAMSVFIDEHYQDDIFLSDIANAVGITPSHAVHLFRPVFDTSPVQHLNSRRIGAAQTALLLTDLSASQIASEVGIVNSNYFYTVFKKLVGISPTSYRTHFKSKIHRCLPNSNRI